MSDISGISSSLLSNLLNSRQANLIQSAGSQAQSPSSENINDIVSLLGASGSSGDPLYGLLSDTQGSDATASTYNLLLGAVNAQLMKDNPTLVEAFLKAEQAQSQPSDTGTSSGSTQSQQTSSQAVQNLENVDLLSISPQNLTAVLEKYLQSKKATGEPASGSQMNQSV
ncbi:MAG TPA: hypothetical protein VMT71_02850 [Syntrophorhabdales bacterium]|nr:hypothetical protein [Syntrophorhabdales bacterium]